MAKNIENIRKRINVKLINDKKTYQKCVSKPSFISHKIFDKNFVAVHCRKTVLTLNKPIYVGFSILELSKLLMYQFHYDYVLKTFNAKLLFTDTDSLVYESLVLETSACLIVVDIQKIKFKVLGKMKDELNGSKIVEFVVLKPKMYSLISSDCKEINKAKGVNNKLGHNEYLNVLFN